MSYGGPLGPYAGPGTARPRPRPSSYWLVLTVVVVAAIVTVGVVVWWLLPRNPYTGYWFPIGGFFVVFLVVWMAWIAIRMSFWRSRRDRYARYRGGGVDPAVRIARIRYARGEISRQEYDELVQRLRPGGPPPG